MAMLSRDKLQLCDIQGRLFELALQSGYDCPAFMEFFMNSPSAEALDDTYDRLQWAGEEYILEELEDISGGLKRAGTFYAEEVMYWSGYLYRYWHYLTGESSRDIYKEADAITMNRSWAGFHTLAPEMAIEDLKDLAKN